MEKDVLVRIFGNKERISVLRVMAQSPSYTFTKPEMVKNLKIKKDKLTKVLKDLLKDGIIVKKPITKKLKEELKTKEKQFYKVNRTSKDYQFLAKLINEFSDNKKDKIFNKVSKIPGIKVVAYSSALPNRSDSDIDVVVCGDKYDDRATLVLVSSFMKELEKILGRDINYTYLSKNDLIHRIQVNDKIIRDFFEFGSVIHYDSLGICESQEEEE